MKHVFLPTELAKLPVDSGVYYFRDAEGHILYVGKATSLINRVRSYWQRPLDARLQLMIPLIKSIAIQTTETALEALILEANEITRLSPKFNVRGKDDKTFAQIAITKEEFPKVLIIRPTQKVSQPIDKTFGPYTSGLAARRAVKALRGLFHFYCTGKPHSGRACLYRSLGECPGVCTGDITASEYRARIQKIIDFLEGKKKQIIRNTKKAMEQASKAQRYEDATELRNELFALTHIRDTAFMTDDVTEFLATSLPNRLEAYDISNIGERAAVGSMVVLEQGRPNTSEYRKFKIQKVQQQSDTAMLREVLSRRFTHQDWPMPDFILIDGGLQQLHIAERVLKQAQLAIPAAGIVKGPTRKLARLVLSAAARDWLNQRQLTTHLFEPVVRLARDEAHRFAITYHRKLRDKVPNSKN
jgi:excinuclease ABC subunit C